MQCISCKSDISPKWKFAIENNSCPCCGDKIMEEELKQLLSTLSSTFSTLSESYPDQLNDWMLVNYNFVKTNSPRLKEFLPKELVMPLPAAVSHSLPASTTSSSVEEDEENEVVNKVSDEQAAKFFKNSGADKVVKRTEELKQLVQKIKAENPKVKAVSTPELDDMDYENEAVDNSYDNPYEENIPAAVLAFANQSNKQNPTYNAKDMLKLQQLQQRAADSRRSVVNGTGGKGSFSRSS